MLRVTTSWDDGDILDKRLVDLLNRYGVKGTFYITKNYRPERLSDAEIREISKTHEIGAHTLTHFDLRSLSPEKQKGEVAESKKWLQNILSVEKKLDVEMFCYPKGFYNESAVRAVREAGFIGARTTNLGFISIQSDSFHMNTTVQVYPFPFRKLNKEKFYWRKILEPLRQRAPTLMAIGIPILSMSSWLSMAKATFDISVKNGEVFHLWGHSWEIEKYGMWNDLEKFIRYIANRKECEYVTNGELIKNRTDE